MMEARVLENEIALLYENAGTQNLASKKQALYTRVGKFLMGIFGGHWWCNYPSLMVFMMRLLELHPSSQSVCVLFEEMSKQLSLCPKCVDIYHSSLQFVRIELEQEFTPASVKSYFNKLSELNIERIHQILKTSSPSNSTFQQKQLHQQQQQQQHVHLSRADQEKRILQLSTTVYEILSNRTLFSDFRIIRIFAKWLSFAPPSEKANLQVDTLRYTVGIYHLLVSPDPGVRSWATSVVHKFGSIDINEEGDERIFHKVLDEWMYILENAAFNTPVLSLDLQETEELTVYLEKTNCVKTPTNQILWAAFDTVMQQMDEDSLDVMLESFDNFPDLVFNTLNEADPVTTNPQITFVIIKCYFLLLQCLRNRFWNHTVHTPKVVLEMIFHHLQVDKWKVFVTKQLIDLLPALLVAVRPPQHSIKDPKSPRVQLYLQSRQRILQLLLPGATRPSHLNTSVLSIAASRAISAIICGCYEARMIKSGSNKKDKKETPKDDGSLPDTLVVDSFIEENSFWWPAGGEQKDLQNIWMKHLYEVLNDVKNPPSLIDDVALTCSIVLRKHVQLLRHIVFSILNDSIQSTTSKQNMLDQVMNKLNSIPIRTFLFEKLCMQENIATIPIVVHGALFECLATISETNCVAVAAGMGPCQEVFEFQRIASMYLRRIALEVVGSKKLINPFVFPVVAQHLSMCLLNYNLTETIDINIIQMLINAGSNNPVTITTANRTSVQLECFLVMVHRQTEAFLHALLNFLQSLRVFDFGCKLSMPSLKKLLFMWTKVFVMLPKDLVPYIIPSSTSNKEGQETTKTSPNDTTMIAAAAQMHKIPLLVNEFIMVTCRNLYDTSNPLPSYCTEEKLLLDVFEFAIAFWQFWSRIGDKNVLHKRQDGLVNALLSCLRSETRPNVQAHIQQLLKLVLETLLKSSTCVLEASTLRMMDMYAGKSRSRPSTQDKKEEIFANGITQAVQKFRKLENSSKFFTKRLNKSANSLMQTSSFKQMQQDRRMALSTSRPSSASKVTGKAQSSKGTPNYSTLDLLRSSSDAAYGDRVTSNSKRQHSFYDESSIIDLTRDRAKSSDGRKSPSAAFDLSKVVGGLPLSHGGASSTTGGKVSSGHRSSKSPRDIDNSTLAVPDTPNLAGLFWRIKNTNKPVPVCSLFPFYRNLLQLMMPILLTKDYEQENGASDRQLEPPQLTFKKSAEYVSAFLPLLLEECVNEIQETMRIWHQSGSGLNPASSSHLLRYESEKMKEGMRSLNFAITQIADVTSTAGRDPQRKNKPFRHGDVVLLRGMNTKNRRDKGTGSSAMFLGIVFISENEKSKLRNNQNGKRHVSAREKSYGNKKENDANTNEEEETLRILFLNDAELESISEDLSDSFVTDNLNSQMLADVGEWRMRVVSNLITCSREYIALRSVDLLPEHLRKTILTPNDFKSSQSELLRIGSRIDDLRRVPDVQSKLTRYLRKLGEMSVSLTDLRTTSIGKAVNKLKKHEDAEVQKLSNRLIKKWTALMDQKDELESPPRFVATSLWSAIKAQYNQSQLQSIHSVLDNYDNGVSLLQGPPGTGKTKTIMGLLSGFLALDPPAHTYIPPSMNRSDSGQIDSSKPPDQTTSAVTFSLGRTSGSGNILRRTDSSSGPSRTSIQALKNASATSVRSRLEQKLAGKSSGPLSVSVEKSSKVRSAMDRAITAASKKYCHILLCAPSNGAVDELVLRIVSDGLLDATGKETKVRGPTIHTTETIGEGYSIVRLGNPLEDAPDTVKSVCLPQILKREMEAHPKGLQLRTLMENQDKIRNSIREAHKKIDASKGKKNKSELPRLHASLAEVSGRIRRLRNEVKGLEAQLTLTILSKARIIAGTLNKCGSGALSGLTRGFDVLIVDEAAQAVELSTLVAIRERVARVVLVGDPQQLPATVKSVVAAKARYDRSLFERIAANGVAPSMLRVQYRMHPFLRDFPSKQFYGGLLKDGGNVLDRHETVHLYTQVLYQPFMIFDVNDTQEEESHGSKYNPKEATFCIDLCRAIGQLLRSKSNPNKRPWTIGFVSPYKEQVRVLRKEVFRLGSLGQNISLEVNTVDGFQGREKDVIIFSSVRASNRGGIGFLKDIRRLNVALTRARLCLFLVGNVRTLQRDNTWNALVQSAEERKLLIHTRGRTFDQVASQIEADRPELKEHYAQMHEKTKNKSTSNINVTTTTTPISTPATTPRPPSSTKHKDSVGGSDLPEITSFSKEKELKSERSHREDRQNRKRPHEEKGEEISNKIQKKQHSSATASSSSHPVKQQQKKRPVSGSGGRGGVLSSILGTASTLAHSTSRVVDKKGQD